MPVLPDQFLNTLEGLPGFDREAFCRSHEQDTRITSIRLNPAKKTDLDFPTGKKIPWSHHGFYLEERPSFTHDPLFHAGCYYVQEPGSMFVEEAMRQTLDLTADLRVLDACAAPGGKSTLACSVLSPASLIVCNEVVKSRASILAENISRWGNSNMVVTNSDLTRFAPFEGFFDAVIADVPCSGSGLFRKQSEAIKEWSEAAVRACAVRQLNLLETLVKCLAPGGVLFYSTCSYSIEEDESIVDWLCTDKKFEPIPLDIDPAWGIIQTGGGYRFYPHLTASEGFFLAALRAPGGGAVNVGRQTRELSLREPDREARQAVNSFVQVRDNRLFVHGGKIRMASPQAMSFAAQAGEHLYIRKAGLCIGELKGKNLVPDQELAWSVDCIYPEKVDLAREDAVSYLRKAPFPLPDGAGTRLFSYKGFGLGWGKLVDRRLNNYLPVEYRIRS